jgi:hypothetical protein
MRRLSFMAGGLALLAAPALAVASCADSARNVDLSPDAEPPQTIGDSSDSSDAGAPAEDAGCEAGDPHCTETELSCAETDFCPMKGAVDTRYALTAIWGSAQNDVWAVGAAGTAIHWDGTAWKPYPIPTGHTLFGVWGSGSGELWTASTYTAAFHGTIHEEDASVEWTPLPALPVPMINDLYPALASVWGRAADDVWIGGGDKVGYPYARVWRTRPGADGGVAWQTLSPCMLTSDCPAVRAIWGRADDDIWLVGDKGRTYHARLADGGVAFTAIESNTTRPLRAVWGANADNVWAAGDEGVIRKASATATTWTDVDVPTTYDLRGLWGSSANDVWAVGAYGTILHFDGNEWTLATAAFPVGPTPTLYAVWGSGPDDVWIVGDGIVLHRSGPTKSGEVP